MLQALIVEEYQHAVPSLENGRHNTEPAGWVSIYVRLRSRIKYCILVNSIGFTNNSADLSHDLIATGTPSYVDLRLQTEFVFLWH